MQIKSQHTLQEKKQTKRNATLKRSPALVQVPQNLANLLNLINLLPIQFRHPSRARKNRISYKDSPYMLYENDILNWNPSGNITTQGLWRRISIAIKELPFLLQAFVLHDDEGKFSNGEIFSVTSEDQVKLNFKLMEKNIAELEEIKKKAIERIDEACQVEEMRKVITDPLDKALGLDVKELEEKNQAHYINPDILVVRVRQRLIFILAAQELLSFLTTPNTQKQHSWLYSRISHLSEFTGSNFYIDSEGKFSIGTPVLYSYFIGIKVNRICECQVCNRYFWAGRKDMSCCSAQCANSNRARKFRDRYPEKYKEQRVKKADTKEQATNRKEKK